MSRKTKGSKNRDKQRVKVARAHAKVADARKDFHHKLSTKLIRENQAISVETLSVKRTQTPAHPRPDLPPRAAPATNATTTRRET